MPPTYWDPEWVELAKTMSPPPPIPSGETEEMRQAMNALMESMPKQLPPPPDDVTSKDFDVRDGIPIRVYRPEGTQNDTLLPIILFAHGGGWFAGNLDTEDHSCRIISSKVPALVVAVDYRCGFHVPLSDMRDDLYAAFDWIQSRAKDHGADPAKLILWGGSAGGSLATSLAYRLVQENRGTELVGLIFMNGVAMHPDATPEEYKHLNTSFGENDGPQPFVSDADAFRVFEQHDAVPPNIDISLFPAAGGADGVKGFPPTYIITSGNDCMRDDGTVLEACLKDAGVRVKRDNVEGLSHYFWVFNLPKANKKFWESMVSGIRWTLEK